MIRIKNVKNVFYIYVLYSLLSQILWRKKNGVASGGPFVYKLNGRLLLVTSQLSNNKYVIFEHRMSRYLINR